MKKILLLAVVFVAATLLNVSTLFAQQQKKEVIVKAVKVEKTRGENPNIKQERPATDVAAPKPDKSRGETCIIGFENFTGYYIDVYVDGIYRGTMAPWEAERRVTLYSGYKSIYCITAGKTMEFKDAGDCDGYFYYKLSL